MLHHPRSAAIAVLAAAASIAASPALACEPEQSPNAAAHDHLALTPDGTTGYVADSDEAVTVVDAVTGEATATISFDASIVDLAMLPDGTELWVTLDAEASASFSFSGTDSWFASADSSADACIVIVDTATNEVTDTITCDSSASGLTFSPDGQTAYGIGGIDSGSVTAIDVETHATTDLEEFQDPSDLAISADGESLWVTEEGSDRVTEIDARTGKRKGSVHLRHGDGARGIAVSDDGSTLYVACPDREEIEVLDTSTGALITTIATSTASASLQLTVDGGTLVISGDAEGTVTTIDTHTYRVTATVTASASASLAVTTTSDSEVVYVETEAESAAETTVIVELEQDCTCESESPCTTPTPEATEAPSTPVAPEATAPATSVTPHAPGTPIASSTPSSTAPAPEATTAEPAASPSTTTATEAEIPEPENAVIIAPVAAPIASTTPKPVASSTPAASSVPIVATSTDDADDAADTGTADDAATATTDSSADPAANVTEEDVTEADGAEADGATLSTTGTAALAETGSSSTLKVATLLSVLLVGGGALAIRRRGRTS